MNSAYEYFENTMEQIEKSLHQISKKDMDELVEDCAGALKSGHKVIASGLGKNVPICEKFEGTMLSLGLEAHFLHTNSAVHGDLGMVKSGDIVIIVTKSGNTDESVYLEHLLSERAGVKMWLLSCNKQSKLANAIDRKLIVPLEHEGDPWNIMPNNSSTLFLIILQTLSMLLAKKMEITLDEFKNNHPGGAIGEKLKNG